MKFHRLQIQNLNSLYGSDHEIDFDTSFGQAPLFLIMGPTGAGKSTILDAICLALFGETHRQRQNPKAVAEAVLSRGEGEASVQLVFSRRDPQNGRQKYRAQWYCNRAYKKPNQSIQEPKRSLDKWRDGQWHALVTDNTTQKEYQPHFLEATAGMEIDDFLRSVLLAQGDFTAFLKADKQKKADILEKLTDTTEYVEIGRRAKERWQRAKENTGAVETELDSLNLLDHDEVQALENQIATLQDKRDQLSKQKQELQAQLTWLQSHDERQSNYQTACEELDEAEAEKDANKEDFQRLKSAQTARDMARRLDAIDELDDEINTLNNQLDTDHEELEEVAEKKDRAEDKLKRAKEKLAQKKKARKAADAALKKARALRSQQPELRQTLKDKTEQRRQAEKSWDQAKDELEKKTDIFDTQQKRAQKTAETLERLSKYEGIENALTGLQARVEQHGKKQQYLRELEKERAERIDKKKQTIARRKEVLKSKRDQQTNLAPLKESFQSAKQSLQQLLGDAATPAKRQTELQKDYEQAINKKNLAENLEEKFQQFTDTRQAIRDHEQSLRELKTSLEAVKDKREDTAESLKKAKENEQEKKEIRDAQKLPIQLIKERNHLQSGQPCPVCGSEEHPYVDNPPELDTLKDLLDRAEEALCEAQTKRRELRSKLGELEKKQVSLEGDHKNKKEWLKTKRKELQNLRQDLDQDAEKLAIQWDLDDRESAAVILEKAIEESRQHKVEIDQALEQLREAKQDHDEARDKLHAAEKKQEQRTQELKAINSSIDDRNEEIDKLDRKIDDQSKSLANDTSDLIDAFKAVGIATDPSEDHFLEQALDTASQRNQEYSDAQKAHRKAEKAVEKERVKLENLKARIPDLKKAFDRAKEAQKKAQSALDSKNEEIQKVLDGEDPDEVEDTLERAIEKAEKAQKEARKSLESFRRAHQELKTKIDEKTKRRAKLTKKRETKYRDFEQALKEHHFDSEEQVRQCAMPDEDIEALQTQLEKITEALNRADENKKSAKKKLAEQTQQKPETLNPDKVSIEELKQSIDELTEELTELSEKLGRKKSKLETDQQKRDKQSTLQAKFDELSAIKRRWTKIHKLIGQNEGENFKKFAQALNLERIVHHANEHLEQLHDRFRLDVKRDDTGHPTLEFEVVDQFNQNQPHSLSTLSGGETFLVSLSLALALADFRQVRMPVETLLLDEGFGTLDQESLREAVTTLNSLHSRDGRQVGVISHVERLKERIGHRLVVKKLGGGRSKLRVETPG